MKEGYRIEKDSIGEIPVANDRFWGAQTERSRKNFQIGHHPMPIEIIHALALIKKSAAIVNCEQKLLDAFLRDQITTAADEIVSGELDDHFPLSTWQTGSGTQTNMNVNEVISNRASFRLKKPLGSKDPLHPNDHVNLSQSTNDVFPSAMHIAVLKLVQEKMLPVFYRLQSELEKKSQEWTKIIKVGRTHLMDATPISLGQEFSGYASQVHHAIQSIESAIPHLSELPIGGTAVGTGLNTKKGYDKRMAEVISQLTGMHFVVAHNKFEALAGKEAMVAMSAALRQHCVVLIKLVNDIRLGASGPRCGFNELILPINEPGSSIMAGKVNPTQCEALLMIAIQVMGWDNSILLAGAMGGAFELNVMMPLIAFDLIESIHLLTEGVQSFIDHCLLHLRPNENVIAEHLNRSLMLATALNAKIGYEKAAQVVKKATEENISLQEAAVNLGFVSEKEFRQIVDPKKMIEPLP